MKEGNLGIKSITEEELRYSAVSSSGIWLLKDLSKQSKTLFSLISDDLSAYQYFKRILGYRLVRSGLRSYYRACPTVQKI